MDESSSDQQTIDEEALAASLLQLRALDNHAWAKLYDGHHPKIWRYAYGRLGNRDAADEVAAQVFTEAVSSIHRYRDQGRPILAWLYVIARNTASKYLRTRRNEIQDAFVEPTADPVDERLDSLVLSEALRHLTKEQREVIALRFFAGYSTREIAAAMGKKEAAVYSLEVRAIGALRRALGIKAENFLIVADKKAPPPGIDR